MNAFAKKSNSTSNPAFVKDKGKEDFFGVQAKLSIGKPNDKYEAEADHAADKVVQRLQTKQQNGNHSPFFSPTPSIQKKETSEEQEIQEKPVVENISPLVQQQPDEEIQEKCDECEKEEKHETQIQEKPVIDSVTPLVQQQPEEEQIQEKCSECEKEEQVQKKEINHIQRETKVSFPPIPEGVTEEKEKQEAEDPSKEKEKTAEEKPKEEGGKKATATEGLIQLPAVKKEDKKEKEKEPVQTKKNTIQKSSGTESSSENIEQNLQSSKGKGSPLPGTTQKEMGSSFGTDFSGVKVHTDSSAVQMNKELGSHAFTHGNDIYFNEGKYDPENESGKHLLAHELTHTIQQGATGESVQRFTPPDKKTQPEGKPEKPNDGAEVEGKSNNKITNDERVQDQDELSEEEKQEKEDPPRGEVHQEKGQVQAEGVSTPPVDRGAVAQEKITEQKEQMNEQLSEEPAAGEGEGENAETAEDSNMAQADAAAQRALQAEQAARSVQIPDQPQPFQHPNVVAPVDSAGEDIPRQANIDTQVRGLGYIGEMLREKGYEMKQHAAEKEIHAHGLDAVLEKQREDLALAKEGTKKIDEQNTERKTISETSKKALDESKQRQQFVAAEAPGLAQEADSGKSESSELASESQSKADQSQSEIPDDPDARADAEQQSGEMNETAGGAQSMDDAITQTGERARQYADDAAVASEDNQQSETSIQETDETITQIDGRVAEMTATNEQSNASIENAGPGPALIRQHAEHTATSGEELIAASIVMEQELNALQDEYLSSMSSLESKEDAEKRLQEEQAQNEPQISPEEQQLYELAAMPDEEQEAQIAQMSEEEKTGLAAALERMIAAAPDNGTDATEGARTKVDLGGVNEAISGAQSAVVRAGLEGVAGDYGTMAADAMGVGQNPADPRAEQIQQIDNQRTQRVSGVLDIADQNMNFISEEQQRMLAERLVGESITDDIKNINVLQMGKDMLMGMVNPAMALQGVVGGFEKTFTGVANIFNADAWAKDPLGNLLQIAADISTGLAMVFSSILGIAGMITALMVALTILSWGTLLPVTTPVIGWMGTVMTYAGWGAIIAGSLSVYVNSLAYIKNLNDAGTATTARELFGNTEQMKQNATDGFQGAMAVVEGVGAVKMGPSLSNGDFIANVPRSPGAFASQTLDGVRGGISSVASLPGRAARGARRLMGAGRQGLVAFKNKIQRFLRRPGGPDLDVDAPTSRRHQDLLDESTTRRLDEMTPEQRRADLAETGNNQPRQIDPDSEFHARYDVEIESNGHTYRRNRDGSGWCRFSSKECGIPEEDLPQSVKDNVEDLTPNTTPGTRSRRQRDFDSEIQRKVDAGEIDADTAATLRQYNDANPSGSRHIDDVIDDINNGKVFNPESGRFRDPNATRSKRHEYVGSTPGKRSRTGREVMDKMHGEGRMRNYPPLNNRTEFLDADGNWYNISQADMGHHPKAAVEYWNETGINHGPRSPEVREWMLDHNNYELEHFSRNRSAGARLGKTYDDPIPDS